MLSCKTNLDNRRFIRNSTCPLLLDKERHTKKRRPTVREMRVCVRLSSLTVVYSFFESHAREYKKRFTTISDNERTHKLSKLIVGRLYFGSHLSRCGASQILFGVFCYREIGFAKESKSPHPITEDLRIRFDQRDLRDPSHILVS